MEAQPASPLPDPPIHNDKEFVVLSDWDGTITTCDSNDYMTDNLGFGPELRRDGNLEVLNGRTTFRDSFRGMLESVSENGHSLERCKEILKEDIKLDPGFKGFYKYCESKDIPVVIVSSGMEPIIRAVLSKLVPDDAAKIDIISNGVTVHSDGRWSIRYRHPSSEYGHDKSRAIVPYRTLANPPTLFFFGDGVSDISAAQHADLLFVKVKDNGENDLAVYCTKEAIPHVLFSDFGSALEVVKKIVEGKTTVEEVLAERRVLGQVRGGSKSEV